MAALRAGALTKIKVHRLSSFAESQPTADLDIQCGSTFCSGFAAADPSVGPGSEFLGSQRFLHALGLLRQASCSRRPLVADAPGVSGRLGRSSHDFRRSLPSRPIDSASPWTRLHPGLRLRQASAMACPIPSGSWPSLPLLSLSPWRFWTARSSTWLFR